MVNRRSSNDGHLDGSERLRSAVNGLGAMLGKTLWVWGLRGWLMPLAVGTIDSSKHKDQENGWVQAGWKGDTRNKNRKTISNQIGSTRSLMVLIPRTPPWPDSLTWSNGCPFMSKCKLGDLLNYLLSIDFLLSSTDIYWHLLAIYWLNVL